MQFVALKCTALQYVCRYNVNKKFGQHVKSFTKYFYIGFNLVLIGQLQNLSGGYNIAFRHTFCPGLGGRNRYTLWIKSVI